MTITNPPSASSQIELGKSHYLIRSLGIGSLVWGELAFGLKYASIHTDVLLRGRTHECVCTQHLNSFAHMDEVYRKAAQVASPNHTHRHTTFQTKSVIHQSTPSATPCVWNQRDRSWMSACVPGFPRVHQQLRRADGPLWYGGLILWGPQWSQRHCGQLCLPPAIGQGSYNRRLGGPGPPRTAPQLSRCGEGVGRGGARLSYCRGTA